MAQEKWLTVRDVAALLKVHPETVRDWLRAGRLHGVAFGGRTGWRITETALNDFIRREDEGKAAA